MNNNLPSFHNCTVAVIGLGYVGLPLAVEIAKTRNCYITKDQLNRKVIGFDINPNRIRELINNYDNNYEGYYRNGE